ncbi:hypothetical protein PI124_g16882 [Phytophthora idaei]|nr:hypothetical protein PI125_g17124 [Phytophthora idaei]KAG3140368.1 hypothetical protein PI126_g16037 [Phytophthora idaei]KAG3238145.1 hypothetical protein PI124_g16882 [Phytophthora idaei]
MLSAMFTFTVKSVGTYHEADYDLLPEPEFLACGREESDLVPKVYWRGKCRHVVRHMAACMLYCTWIVTFAVIWTKVHYDQNHIVVNTEGCLAFDY